MLSIDFDPELVDQEHEKWRDGLFGRTERSLRIDAREFLLTSSNGVLAVRWSIETQSAASGSMVVDEGV